MPRAVKGTEPALLELPPQTMAVVRSVGDPNEVGEHVFKSLYGAVYGLKFALKKVGVEYKVGPPRARWFGGADWRDVPREQWGAAWGIPVPDGTAPDSLRQTDPSYPVSVEIWDYGQVAQVLHLGAYADEEPAIERLHAFIAEQGLRIVGPHEEEYLSTRRAKVQKTMIRYQVGE